MGAAGKSFFLEDLSCCAQQNCRLCLAASAAAASLFSHLTIPASHAVNCYGYERSTAAVMLEQHSSDNTDPNDALCCKLQYHMLSFIHTLSFKQLGIDNTGVAGCLKVHHPIKYTLQRIPSAAVGRHAMTTIVVYS